jgi:hypothetical protein
MYTDYELSTVNTINEEWEEDQDSLIDSPEKRLLYAVLHRAITDLLCDSDPRSQLDAREWFLTDLVSDPWLLSFQGICLHLEMDWYSLQQKILCLEADAKSLLG